MRILTIVAAFCFGFAGFASSSNAQLLSFQQAVLCVDLAVEMKEAESELQEFLVFLQERNPGQNFRYYQTQKGAASLQAMQERYAHLNTYGKVLLPWDELAKAEGRFGKSVDLQSVGLVYLQILDGLGTEGVVVADEMFATAGWSKETVLEKAGQRFAEAANMSKELLFVCENSFLEAN